MSSFNLSESLLNLTDSPFYAVKHNISRPLLMNLCSQYRPTDSNCVKLGSGKIHGSIVSPVTVNKN